MAAFEGREFVLEVIDRYRSNPCLWLPKHKDYYDRKKKDKALDDILPLFQARDPSASRETVWKKLITLRGCFSKEYRKVKASLSRATEPDEVHIPKLWYFDKLTFLKDLPPALQEVEASIREAEEQQLEEEAPPPRANHLVSRQQPGPRPTGSCSLPSDWPPSSCADPSLVQSVFGLARVWKVDMEWTKAAALKLIDLYRERECLWDPNNCRYKDKSRRSAAWAEISEQLGATVTQVRKKMESLLTSFRRERQREESPGDHQEGYCSTWFAFDRMAFLQDKVAGKITSRKEKDPLDDSQGSPAEPPSALKRPPPLTDQEPEPSPAKRQTPPFASPPLLPWPQTSAEGPLRRPHDAFGEHVAEKLRSLPPEMVPFCQKLISDAIFLAEMRRLDMSSRIVSDTAQALPPPAEVYPAKTEELDIV